MRPTAKINELALAIKADGRLICQARVDVFDFQILIQIRAQLSCFIAIEHLPFKRLFRFDDLLDFRFDLGEVFFADRLGNIKVVIEPAISGRTEGKRDAFVKTHDRLSHDVC